jgi:hypothetical protein
VALLAVDGAINRITGLRQRMLQLAAKIRIVFNNKQSHVRRPRFLANRNRAAAAGVDLDGQPPAVIRHPGDHIAIARSLRVKVTSAEL